MNRVFVQGLGAVSPAGWGVAPLLAAVERGDPLPVTTRERPGWPRPHRVRAVPAPAVRPAFLAHPRVRRAGEISRYALAAALEALGTEADRQVRAERRLGVIVCVMAGGISYSRRFYDETLKGPATASPLLFPETVFNAPASHVATCLGTAVESATLLGDEGAFLQGLALGAGWIARDVVDGCVVVGAEELDWLVSDALSLFSRSVLHADGAGALYLSAQTPASSTGGVELVAVTDAHAYTDRTPVAEAARRMRAQLPPLHPDEWLVLSGRGSPADAVEAQAWADWTGPSIAPKRVLGEAFPAAAAWQCVLACGALAAGRFAAANVSVVGANQQAIGARFRVLKEQRPL